MFGDSNDETIFHTNYLLLLLLLFANLPANIKLSKIIQLDWFLDILLGPLPKNNLPLMKNALTPLAKGFFIPLGLTAAASATNAVIQKIIDRSGVVNEF